MRNIELKNQLLKCCQDYVDERLNLIKSKIEDIHNSLLTETKSSAGDKHETGRAMLQLEREKLGSQLAEVQKLNETLTKIDIQNFSATIKLGSVVYTKAANYFLAISVGEIFVNKEKFFAISLNTPIARLLLGKEIGYRVVFRDTEIKVLNII